MSIESGTMTCQVCCDPYTKETRKPVACAACAYEACSRCVKTFLLSTPTEPNCMNCHHVWNREFLDQHLTRTWREGELKAHRADLLFDRERSLLPTTQEDVIIELQKRAYAVEITDLCEKQQALRSELDAIKEELEVRQRYIRHGPAGGEAKEKRQFVAACPIESCRGFLSTAYKCGTCQEQFCPSCRELRSSEEHTCNPDLVATIQAIVKDSRPCPNCGMAISKVSGCDQMYCTACDTAYSYQTGKVVTGVIHNPHYFEKMRSLHGSLPRQPGDQCGGWPVFHNLPYPIRNDPFLRSVFQSARHLEQVELPEYANPAVLTDNRDLRVRFLLKELDEKKFKQLVQQRDRKRQRELEIRGPLELFVITALEFFLQKPKIDKATALKEQIEMLVNAPLRAIGERYGNRVPQIDLTTGRFT